jgi:hypothetical protein
MSYPNKSEQFMLDAARKLMQEAMARYDPSHDKYHGISRIMTWT